MKYAIFGIKVVAILALISAGYYFGYLKPHEAKVKLASAQISNLVQNRSAYVSLAKLDPEGADFDIQKSNLIGIIKETNTRGLQNPISNEEKEILERQNTLLNKVFATNSYEAGVSILKSNESVKLLQDMTDLIKKLQ